MRRTAAVLAGCLVSLVGGGHARQTPPQPMPQFRAGVEVVQVDVSVLDRDRRPVRGLTAADFSVLEDQRPQAIVAFTAIDVPEAEESPVAWMRDVPPDIRRNDDLGNRRLVILVMDDATPMPAAEVPLARDAARRVVERLGPDDLTAVVFAFDKGAGQEFTQDRARLLAAVGRFNGGIDRGPLLSAADAAARNVPFDEFNTNAASLYQAAIGTLRSVAEYLAELPQRRKALIFVSVGVPLDIREGEAPDITRASIDTSGVTYQLISELQNVFRAAQRANVNVYGLDPGGLRPPGTGAGGVDPLTGGAAAATPAVSPGILNHQFLGALSANTGGFAFTNWNDVERDLTQVLRENGSYYLLGYQPANTRTDGRFHRIEVVVNRPGVTVRARTGYFAPSAGKGTKSSAVQAPLASALGGLLPKTDLSMRVAVAPFAVPGRRDTALAIVAGFQQPAPPRRMTQEVELIASAFDAEGRPRGSQRQTGSLVLRPADGATVQYEVLSRIDLKPGRYDLRLAAYNATLGKSGSVYYDVEIPDFSKQVLSLSGVLLSATPAVKAASTETLAALVPIVPTSQREFTRDDRVTGFLRVYQGGTAAMASVTLAVRIIDGRNATVFSGTETLTPDRFGPARATDYRVDLPVGRLARGPYLLTFDARRDDGTSARRDVRFAVVE